WDTISPPGEGVGLYFCPSPEGEGGPRPAHSPAGAGRVRGLCAGAAEIAFGVYPDHNFDGMLGNI
ncbi:MAG: hypothetical protein ACRD3O_21275, partial [Terriglobia bacterium]